jgi:hypothetical protein
LALLAILTVLPILAVLPIRTVAVAIAALAVAIVSLMVMLALLIRLLPGRTIVVPLRIERSRLRFLAAKGLRLALAGEVIAVAVLEIIRALTRPLTGSATRNAVHDIPAALGHLLLAIGHDDAIVVLGVLQIVFR